MNQTDNTSSLFVNWMILKRNSTVVHYSRVWYTKYILHRRERCIRYRYIYSLKLLVKTYVCSLFTHDELLI